MKRKLSRLAAALLCLVLLLSLLPAGREAAAEDSNGRKIVVSLGDSYSSGEGIEPFYGQSGSMAVRCLNQDWLAHRSENSWPGMLEVPGMSGTMKDYRHNNWFFAAASGATTNDILRRQNKHYDRDGVKGDKTLEPQIDIFNQIPKGAHADYVTLTLGGNDAGFSDIIQEAVTGSTYLKTSRLADKLNAVWAHYYESGGIRDCLRYAYKDITERAGKQATLIVAGYPRLLEPSGKGMYFSREEAELINTAVHNFNQEIEALVQSCASKGMNICFVSVEKAFENNAAYASDAWINPVWLVKRDQDLEQFGLGSAYSMHPNYSGACAYARCVNAKIRELESGETTPVHRRETSAVRDVVLVLDTSGSMEGTPIRETRKAASKFVQTVLQQDASVGIVTYDTTAMQMCDFSKDESYLLNTVESIYPGGRTNIEDGLRTAEEMFSASEAKKKIIVLMTDGLPNEGRRGDELVAYADSLKEQGFLLYTLGFFEDMAGYEKQEPQALLQAIASEGCHYEVDSADNLQFFFGDVADQINGTSFIYVRIACPVDVAVSWRGEVLNRSNTRTSFGSLTFEENEESAGYGVDNRTKILRLREGADYAIEMRGTGEGTMSYTVGFMDGSGKYTDLREIRDVPITETARLQGNASRKDETVLKLDRDGDGTFDRTYHGGGGEKKSPVLWIILGVVGGLLLVGLAVWLILRRRRAAAAGGPGAAPRPVRQKPAKQKKPVFDPDALLTPEPPKQEDAFCGNCGAKVAPGSAFCPNCGSRM